MISVKRFLGITALSMTVALLFTGCNKQEDDKQEYEPTSSITMTESEAAALGEKVRVVLYFTDHKGERLFTENQLVEFSAKDRRAENMAKTICEMLAQGPANANLYINTLPKDTVVRSVKLSHDVATVDFNGSFLSGLSQDSTKLDLMVCAITNTLTELKEINRVIITTDGKAPGKMECGYEFKESTRNLEMVSLQAASAEVDYSEEAFSDVPLE